MKYILNALIELIKWTTVGIEGFLFFMFLLGAESLIRAQNLNLPVKFTDWLMAFGFLGMMIPVFMFAYFIKECLASLRDKVSE